MRSLPEPSEQQILQDDNLASRIWEEVVSSMSEFTHDSLTPKFTPAEELLVFIRPVAAAFTQIHFTPLPSFKTIYKSHLYALFCFSIIYGMQVYIKQRSILKAHAPYEIQISSNKLRETKNSVFKQLTEGLKVFPPLNQVMDIFLNHIMLNRSIEKINIKNSVFDRQKFNKFLPVTFLWGYLFAREIITDK